MTRVVLPSGVVHHKPPYTQEESDDIYRRVAGMETFTRPSRKAPNPSQRPQDREPPSGPEEPQSGEGPGDPDLPPASPSPIAQ